MLDKLNPVDLSSIQDENARELIIRLMNLIEAVSTDLREAQTEIQRLRDENNRLKAEQGKLNIKGNKPKPPWSNYSSEQECRKLKPRRKRSKKATIEIHREQTLEVDRTTLPEDAELKGYEDVVVQDVVLLHVKSGSR
jgi:predicted  nucleic acid-binding Zn-ribbon protein